MTIGERFPSYTTSRLIVAGVLVFLFGSGTVLPVHAAVPPVPRVSGPIAGPGVMSWRTAF